MKTFIPCLSLAALLSSGSLIPAFAQATGSVVSGSDSPTHPTHDVTSNGGTPNNPGKTSTGPNAGTSNPVAPSPTGGPDLPGTTRTPSSVSQNNNGTTPTVPNDPTNPNPKATNGGWVNSGGSTSTNTP